ncbi:MAG: DUF6268 family outer membrane beta-barrel protein [Phycisphaerales bacterium JB039]
MIQIRTRLLLSILAAGAGAASAAAQDAPPLEAQTGPDFPLWDYRISADGYATTDSGFADGSGQMRRAVIGGEFGTTITLAPTFQLLLDARAELRDYEFSGATEFDPVNGAPFESLYRTYLEGLALIEVDDRWQLAFGTRLASQGETDADFNDTLTARVYAGPIYTVNENLTLGLGILVQSRLEDNPYVLPAPYLEYQFQSRPAYTLRLRPFEGIDLRYEPSETYALAFEFDWEYNEFRLSDDGFAADGVYRETSLRLGVEGQWRPNPNLDLTAGIGSFIWQDVELLDAGGGDLTEDSITPNAYLSLGIEYRF